MAERAKSQKCGISSNLSNMEMKDTAGIYLKLLGLF